MLSLSLSSLDGAFAGVRGSIQRYLSAKRVLMALTAEGFICAWLSNGDWVWASVSWPEGICRQGYPQQPEALADLIADFLLDVGIVGAQVELLLPLELCDWRIFDGINSGDPAGLNSILLGNLPWPHDADKHYVVGGDCFGSLLAVAVSRAGLQDWIDIFDQADLQLSRVDWLLSSAFSGLMGQLSRPDSDLAWLVSHQGHDRLILLRQGVPEVDQVLAEDFSDSRSMILDAIQSWKKIKPVILPTPLWITSPIGSHFFEIDFGENVAQSMSNQDTSSMVCKPFHSLSNVELLDPLVCLGLIGLGLEFSAG